jgi:indolepyruvate ferredoxin oxidoreductase beta subunit
MSGLDIMIVGVGGQGTLLASRVIGSAATAAGYDVKVSEVHGMSQRGGSVVTYVRFGDKIASPLVDVGCADLILSFEQLEAARFLGYLKPGSGIVITNEQVIDPMPVISGAQKYPDDVIPGLKKTLGERAVTLDAAGTAKRCGDIRSVNIVLLGVMAGLGLGKIDRKTWDAALEKCVPPKSLEINRRAFAEGFKTGSERKPQ